MAVPTKIQHPLLARPGASQRKRADTFERARDTAHIDGRSLADLLDYIHRYARQVVFPNHNVDSSSETSLELGNWLPFFERSLPFRLARFAKTDFDQLWSDLTKIVAAIEQSPEEGHLALLADFCFYELIRPIEDLHEVVVEYDFDLGPYLNRAIGTLISQPLGRYVLLCNIGSKYFSLKKRAFTKFSEEPWSIAAEILNKDFVEEIFPDKGLAHIPGGREGAVLWLKDELAKSAFQILRALREVAREPPKYLEASLEANRERHEPHLGLLFTFLKLFQDFQGDLDRLPQKHLAFFYKEVLRIKPKGFVPDKVHLVFEIGKHLKSYKIERGTDNRGTDFKDGKDSKNIDIIFRLDDEIVIDLAQVKALKTLYLQTSPGSLTQPAKASEQSVVEGVYMAPLANSSDGAGKEFREGQNTNWATLGSKVSKYIAPGKEKPENHPFGRLGFVLASPALWLNEGRRDIKITIECDASENGDIFTDCFWENLQKSSEKIFYKISEQTIRKIENVLSFKARTLLQEILDTAGVISLDDIDTKKTGKGKLTEKAKKAKEALTEKEEQLIRDLINAPVPGRETPLREMPFAPLIRSFNLLRLRQDPYPVGLDLNAFLRAEDPVTCKPMLNDVLIEKIRPLFDQDIQKADWFEIQFSGEKGWFAPKERPKDLMDPKDPNKPDRNKLDPNKLGSSKVGILVGKSSIVALNKAEAGTATLTFYAHLGTDEPKVTFYDAKAGKEAFDLEVLFPMVKIELNPEIQASCKNQVPQDKCCLHVSADCGCESVVSTPPNVVAALYHFLRHLKVKTTKINVAVCGLKSLVVQNDESLQDVNAPILPFGARPKVGAEFYIGSKELFGKNWQQFWICTNWKSKPNDFKQYYAEYYAKEYDGSQMKEIDNKSFKYSGSILENHRWIPRLHIKPDPPTPIFIYEGTEGFCNRAAISPSDIKDLKEFLKKLRDQSGPSGRVSEFLWKKLDKDTQDLVKKYLDDLDAGKDEDARSIQKELAETLVNILNNLNENIYETSRFNGITLRDKTTELLAQHPLEDLARLNRLLLEDAYPELSKNEETLYCKEFRRQEFEMLAYVPKSLKPDRLGPLTVTSKGCFFRMRLEERDFQHDRYAFVLARKLNELADAVGADALVKIRDLHEHAKAKLVEIQSEIDKIKGTPAQPGPISQIDSLITAIETKIDDLGDVSDPEVRDLLSSTTWDAITTPLGLVTALLDTMVQYQTLPTLIELTDAASALTDADAKIKAAISALRQAKTKLDGLVGDIVLLLTQVGPLVGKVRDGVDKIEKILKDDDGLGKDLEKMGTLLKPVKGPIPNEPYTPTIKAIELDYAAVAYNDDIELIHLYPFENSSKTEHLALDENEPTPTLLPIFTDEGTLFVGLENITPGATLEVLFQFAEATADSESDPAEINWHYLTGNRWQPLRLRFEILSDATQGLTRSGIVKIAVPRDISNVGNTLMPPNEDGTHLYWLKASAPKSVAAVAELIGVHTQAGLATYQPLLASDTNPLASDTNRVAKPLAPAQVSKPLEPNFNIKKVEQPYSSFAGRLSEDQRLFGIRISELLRHKGRSVDLFDFEHLVLEAFPELYKCKCISHTMGLSANEYRRDLEVAPGFITVAVVPDLRKLVAGDILEPRAPVSLLSDVKAFLKDRASPFARVRVMNPRYERIRVDLKVRLSRGRDETYYAAQLKKELTQFLAPWYVGDSSKLSFGQHVFYSDVIGFIENREYVEFISGLKLTDSNGKESKDDEGPKEIVPLTARSILTGGEICLEIDREDCGEVNQSKNDSSAEEPPKPPWCGSAYSFSPGAEQDSEPLDESS